MKIEKILIVTLVLVIIAGCSGGDDGSGSHKEDPAVVEKVSYEDAGTYVSNFKKEDLSYRLLKENLFFYDDELGLFKSAYENKTEFMNYFLGTYNVRHNAGLYGAALGGHLKSMEVMLEKGADDLNGALKYAALGGHKNTVEWLIDKGANDLNGAFEYSVESGNRELMDYLADQGADDVNRGLIGAARGGQIDIVKLMIDEGAKAFAKSLTESALAGRFAVVEMLVEQSDLETYDLSDTIYKLKLKRGSLQAKQLDKGLISSLSQVSVYLEKMLGQKKKEEKENLDRVIKEARDQIELLNRFRERYLVKFACKYLKNNNSEVYLEVEVPCKDLNTDSGFIRKLGQLLELEIEKSENE